MNENDQNNELNDKGKNPFSLPGDYFGSFSKKMLYKIELADEIKEFKMLSSIDKRLPFVTPENYFAQAANSVGAQAELGNYRILSSIEKTNAFATPALYFEAAANITAAKVELAEELKPYSSLSRIEKTNSFAVPPAYFENLSYEVRQKTASGKNETAFGKVIQLVFSKQTAYALAAMLVLSLGLYYFTNEKAVIVNNGDCQTLACLDKKDIKENQLLHIDEESLMEVVNPETLSKNLKENLASSPAETASDKKEKEDYVLENTDVNDIVDGI
ncbi:MAG: hypothetical protein ACXVPQ_03270 [Bacteroidia bacterium]